MKSCKQFIGDVFTIMEEAPNSVLNVKALEGTFNQEKAIVGAFSMIIKPIDADGSFAALIWTLVVHAACDGWRDVCNTGAHCSVMTSWHLVTIGRPTLSPYLDIIHVYAVHYCKTWTVIIINTRHEHYPETRKIIPRTLSRDTKQCSKTLNIIPRHRTLYQDTVHYPETPNIIPRHRTLSRADYPLPGDSCGCVCPRRVPATHHWTRLWAYLVIKCNHHHNFILESLDCQISYGRWHYKTSTSAVRCCQCSHSMTGV